MSAPPVALFDLAEAVGRWVVWAMVSVLNLLIAALGGVLSAIASLFPSLPAVPGPPSGGQTALDAIGWVFPWGALAALIGILITAYVSLLAFRVVARWVKLL